MRRSPAALPVEEVSVASNTSAVGSQQQIHQVLPTDTGTTDDEPPIMRQQLTQLRKEVSVTVYTKNKSQCCKMMITAVIRFGTGKREHGRKAVAIGI